ncbi:MAG: hypothetical protein HXY52_05245 [Nitrospirae bacterium]|jgi:transcriptional antiterminator RfaH|nr:hypothetical protein [Nitrospirota bacterium]
MWYAIYVKSGKEDTVSSHLKNAGIEVINARLRIKKFKNNKLTEVIEPLFPCYIFADFDKDKYSHMITYTRGVRYIVGRQNPIVVHEEIIKAIKENMNEDSFVIIKPHKFKKGEKVLIREGPLKNFYGIFEKELKGSDRVMILLETLNYKVVINGTYLEIA